MDRDKKLSKMFLNARASAKRRGIGFVLTLEDWMEVWQDILSDVNDYAAIRIDKTVSFRFDNMMIKRKHDVRKRAVQANGRSYESVNHAARHFKITPPTVLHRIRSVHFADWYYRDA